MIKVSTTQYKIIRALYNLKLWKKLSNYIFIEGQKSVREEFVTGYPYWLVIDPTNICTLKCPFCPTGQNRNSRVKAIMSFDKFKKIIDELGPYLIHIDFCNWGEPLLNKDIYKMIEHAKQFNIDTKVDSNLNQLTEEDAQNLILSGLDKLIVSIDGITPETYSKYRVGGDYVKVMENLNLVLKKKRELGRRNPYISWQFLVFRHNEHEIEGVKKIAKDLGVDHIGITKAFIGDKDWIPVNPQYSHYNQEKIKEDNTEYTSHFFNDTEDEICNWPWEAVVINSNGSVSVCCSVEDEKDDFGNVFEDSFKDIWNNDKYRLARKYIKDRETALVMDSNICAGCKHSGMINFDILSCHSFFSK